MTDTGASTAGGGAGEVNWWDLFLNALSAAAKAVGQGIGSSLGGGPSASQLAAQQQQMQAEMEAEQKRTQMFMMIGLGVLAVLAFTMMRKG